MTEVLLREPEGALIPKADNPVTSEDIAKLVGVETPAEEVIDGPALFRTEAPKARRHGSLSTKIEVPAIYHCTVTDAPPPPHAVTGDYAMGCMTMRGKFCFEAVPGGMEYTFYCDASSMGMIYSGLQAGKGVGKLRLTQGVKVAEVDVTL